MGAENAMNRAATVERLELGSFLAPADHPAAGQRIVVCGFLVRHPDALILVDTGIAPHLPDEDEQLLRFHRTDIGAVLEARGVRTTDVDVVVNSHLHADHAGGNSRFPGTPIHAQPEEVAAAREPDYTMPDAIGLDTLNYRVTSGDHELVPGVTIIRTPGHSPGHQAVVVEVEAGRLVLAGQAFRWASEFAMAVHAWRLAGRGDAEPPPFPDWVPRMMEFDPRRVAFAHDLAIWQADA